MKMASVIAILAPGVLASPALAQCPTAEFELTSPQAGLVVDPGTIVDWSITINVSAGDNDGLSVFSVDFVQDVLNPEKFDLPPASIPTPADVMAGFTRPDGICNPGPGGFGSGYGGTQLGPPGQMDLRQIGGAQNTMGIIGSAMGLDITVDPGIGQAGAQLVADGWFSAPSTPGCYTFSLQDAVAKVLDPIDPDPIPPAHWPIRQAMVQFADRSFSFSVSGGTPCQGACCKADGTCLLTTEEDCDVQEGFYQGHYSTCLHTECEVTGACCEDDGTCTQKTDQGCTGSTCLPNTPCTSHIGTGGTYQGDGTVCNGTACPPPTTGACCLAEGTCLPGKTRLECASADGVYLGDSAPCNPNSCEGACCIDELTCEGAKTENECVTEGGNYQGHGTNCTGMDCTAGACCLSVDACVEATEMSCDYERGLYEGDGTDCTSTFCENCADGGGAARCPAKEFNKLTADDAAAGDRFGHSVAIDGAVAVVGSPRDDDPGPLGGPTIVDAGSVYVTRRFDNDACIEEVRITAPDAAASDEFGAAVAIAGDFMVVGAPFDDDNGFRSGSAYVFKYSGSTWAPDGPKLHASNATAGDRFGWSAAISGDGTVAVIGAIYDDHGSLFHAGSAYVFRRYEDDHPCSTNQDCEDVGLTNCTGTVGFCDGVAWVEEAHLVASDMGFIAAFGSNVDIDYDADTIVVGAAKAIVIGNDYSGQVYVFEYALGAWVEKAILRPLNPMLNDKLSELPMPVSITDAGDLVLAGSPWDDSADACLGSPFCDSGAAYVYKEPGGGWSGVVNEDARITSCDLDLADNFGWSVSVSAIGDVALVGAPSASNETGIGGATYAYRFNGTFWYEEAKFTAIVQGYNDEFGYAISLSDDTGLIGAPEDDEMGTNAGGAYVFRGVGDCDGTASLDICDILADPSVDFPLAHDCCETGHGAGCSDEGIEVCVCLTSPNPDIWCCETYWDDFCVAHVEDPAFGCEASCGEGNGIPFACEDCPADLNDDDDVGPMDLAMLLHAWGACPGGCPEDLSGDCEVGPIDLAILLGSWGPCDPAAQWNGGSGDQRFAFGGGNGCLTLEEAVQMLGYNDVGEFIEWVLSAVPPDMVYQVAQFLLWLLDHWPC